MYNLREYEVSCFELAQFLNVELSGNNFFVTQPATVDTPVNNAVIFVEKVTPEIIERLNEYDSIVVICSEAFHFSNGSIIVTENPRLSFVKIINEFFVENDLPSIHSTAILSESAVIGRNVSIGPGSIIGSDVVVGNDSEIQSGVVITGKVTIGNACVIKDRVSIGGRGYGFIEDENRKPIHFPQCGRIIIGERVWIGTNSTIERAAFSDTIIGSDIKIDDLVHIGSGSKIGDGSMLTAGVVLSKDVVIGSNCWLMPNVSIRNSMKIADHITVGIGSVVVADLLEAGIYFGNPAKLRKK